MKFSPNETFGHRCTRKVSLIIEFLLRLPVFFCSIVLTIFRRFTVRRRGIASTEQNIFVSASVLRTHYDVNHRIDAGRQINKNVTSDVETPPIYEVLESFRKRYRQITNKKRGEYNEYHFQQFFVLGSHFARFEWTIFHATKAWLPPEDARFPLGSSSFRWRVRSRTRVIVRNFAVVPCRLRAQQSFGISYDIGKKHLRHTTTFTFLQAPCI